jgi:iron(III) transport system permease protein
VRAAASGPQDAAPSAAAREAAGPALADRVPGLVLGVAAALLLLFVGYPLLWLALGAFGLPRAAGTGAFVRIATQPANVTALLNTLELTAGVVLLSTALGVPLAWATARTDLPARGVIHALVALSYITPPYLSALAYIILMGPNAGFLNRLVVALTGGPRGPFNVFTAAGVIVVIALHVFPFTYFLTYAALGAIDAPLEESAQLLGAGHWTILRRVTLPLAAPAITGGALLGAVESMALFGPQAFLGLPARIVYLPTRIYGLISSYPPRFADASALALVLVILTLAGLAVQRRYLEGRSFFTIGGRGVRPRRTRLGPFRWPLLGACGTVVVLSALAPLAVLVAAAFSRVWTDPLTPANLTLANFRAALFEDQTTVRGIVNSFRLAIGAATLATALGLAIAYLDVRTTVRGRRWLDYLAILPLGLPGTVMAVALLQAFIRPPLRLYGTVWILLVAYVARFIPLAVRSANASLRQIDPSLEEAGRITGGSWAQVVRRIIVPIVRPNLLLAWLLVFIPALSELSATILLYTSGTETIAVAVFRLNDLGRLEVVAALAVFTVAVILLAALATQWLAGRRGIAVVGEMTAG